MFYHTLQTFSAFPCHLSGCSAPRSCKYVILKLLPGPDDAMSCFRKAVKQRPYSPIGRNESCEVIANVLLLFHGHIVRHCLREMVSQFTVVPTDSFRLIRASVIWNACTGNPQSAAPCTAILVHAKPICDIPALCDTSSSNLLKLAIKEKGVKVGCFIPVLVEARRGALPGTD